MNWRFDEFVWLRHVEFTAIVAIAIAVACVMIGQGAERYAENANGIALADAKSQSPQQKSGPVFNAIDYAATGSVKGQTIILSPCGIQPAASTPAAH